MSFRLTLEGLDELRAALRQLPEALATEASDIVSAHANAAERDIVGGYPQGSTGNLRNRVTIEHDRTKVSVSARVRSRSPHAHLFEDGTARRQTTKGYNRGRMPVAPQDQSMIPKAIRWRARMYARLAAMLEREGFEVSQ